MKRLSALFFMMMSLSASLSFLSCSSGNDDNKEEEEVIVTPIDLKFMACVTKSQSDYFDMTFTLNTNSKESKTIKLSEMTEVKDASTISKNKIYSNALQIFNTYASHVGNDSMRTFVYDMGQTTGVNYNSMKINFTLKSDHPKDEQLNLLSAIGVYTTIDYKGNGNIDAQIYADVDKSEANLKQLCIDGLKSGSTFSY